ncbi:hypothetical protein KCP73_11045 [Salmonella enterica subsp. enterica]|nr:hypothetical protein KCP73_11045 [Salmonella enterica subsp. enterica]
MAKGTEREIIYSEGNSRRHSGNVYRLQRRGRSLILVIFHVMAALAACGRSHGGLCSEEFTYLPPCPDAKSIEFRMPADTGVGPDKA